MKLIRRKKQRAEISMINLIDVIFMLLIFFMLTTIFNTFTYFNINLPKSSIFFDMHKKDNVEIFFNKDKNIILKINKNEFPLSYGELKLKLNNLSNEHKESILVSADEALSYGNIVELMVLLKDSDIKNIELNIKTNN